MMLLARRPEETTAIVLVITSAVNDASVICGLLSLAAFLPVALKYRACRFQKYCFFLQFSRQLFVNVMRAWLANFRLLWS